jgi:hypothetical protein
MKSNIPILEWSLTAFFVGLGWFSADYVVWSIGDRLKEWFGVPLG